MKVKKVLSLLMAMIFILGVTAVPTFAADEQEDIQLRWETCGNCNERMYESTVWGGNLQTSTRRNCTHGHAYGEDRQWKQEGLVTVKCSKCANGYTYKTYRYSWVCHGYDTR